MPDLVKGLADVSEYNVHLVLVSEAESDLLVSEGDSALGPAVWAKAVLPTVVYVVVFKVCDKSLCYDPL